MAKPDDTSNTTVRPTQFVKGPPAPDMGKADRPDYTQRSLEQGETSTQDRPRRVTPLAAPPATPKRGGGPSLGGAFSALGRGIKRVFTGSNKPATKAATATAPGAPSSESSYDASKYKPKIDYLGNKAGSLDFTKSTAAAPAPASKPATPAAAPVSKNRPWRIAPLEPVTTTKGTMAKTPITRPLQPTGATAQPKMPKGSATLSSSPKPVVRQRTRTAQGSAQGTAQGPIVNKPGSSNLGFTKQQRQQAAGRTGNLSNSQANSTLVNAATTPTNKPGAGLSVDDFKRRSRWGYADAKNERPGEAGEKALQKTIFSSFPIERARKLDESLTRQEREAKNQRFVNSPVQSGTYVNVPKLKR